VFVNLASTVVCSMTVGVVRSSQIDLCFVSLCSSGDLDQNKKLNSQDTYCHRSTYNLILFKGVVSVVDVMTFSIVLHVASSRQSK
jgi:hypothetical protein